MIEDDDKELTREEIEKLEECEKESELSSE